VQSETNRRAVRTGLSGLARQFAVPVLGVIDAISYNEGPGDRLGIIAQQSSVSQGSPVSESRQTPNPLLLMRSGERVVMRHSDWLVLTMASGAMAKVGGCQDETLGMRYNAGVCRE